MSAARRILSLADCFCWRADMSVSISPFRRSDGVQAAPLNAPVHETGDIQGGRDDADAVADDLGRDEESVHNQSPLGSAHLPLTRRPLGYLRPIPKDIPTSWYVIKCCFSGVAWLRMPTRRTS